MGSNYQKIKDWVKIALVSYAIIGSIANYDKTGHVSADIHSGLTTPTKLDCFIIEKLGGNLEKTTQEAELKTD